jgi:hypothetical protein
VDISYATTVYCLTPQIGGRGVQQLVATG